MDNKENRFMHAAMDLRLTDFPLEQAKLTIEEIKKTCLVCTKDKFHNCGKWFHNGELVSCRNFELDVMKQLTNKSW